MRRTDKVLCGSVSTLVMLTIFVLLVSSGCSPKTQREKMESMSRFEIIDGTRASAHKLVSHGEAVTFRDTQTGDCFFVVSATRNFAMTKVDCPAPHFGEKSNK